MQPRSFTTRLMIAALLGTAATGCTPEVRNYIRFPNFSQPGWAHQQRFDALEHDPYPLDDMGPEVVGGRPREYQRPIPEVERARQGTAPPPGLQPLGVPSLPFAPPVVTGPPVMTTPPVVTTPATPTQAPPFPVQQRAPY